MSLYYTRFNNEINAGRPILFTVDENGTGNIDHVIPVFGYETVGGVNYYACYTTDSGDTTPLWKPFVDINYEGSGPFTPYAVDESITITSIQAPEPTTLISLISGIGFLMLIRKRN